MSPSILRTRNLDVRIYPKDHNPPHVHVKGPHAEAKFLIDTLECVSAFGFSKKSLARIQVFLKDHQKALMEAWHEFQK